MRSKLTAVYCTFFLFSSIKNAFFLIAFTFSLFQHIHFHLNIIRFQRSHSLTHTICKMQICYLTSVVMKYRLSTCQRVSVYHQSIDLQEKVIV